MTMYNHSFKQVAPKSSVMRGLTRTRNKVELISASSAHNLILAVELCNNASPVASFDMTEAATSGNAILCFRCENQLGLKNRCIITKEDSSSSSASSTSGLCDEIPTRMP